MSLDCPGPTYQMTAAHAGDPWPTPGPQGTPAGPCSPRITLMRDRPWEGPN